MVATIEIVPETGNPVAAQTACHITAVGIDSVDEAFDPETESPELRYYLSLEKTGEDSAVSPRFSRDFTWDGYVFPSTGSWTAHVRKDSDDSSVANLAITVD